MRSLLFVGGEPGVGKTTLVRQILPGLGPCASTHFHYGSIYGHLYPQTRVLVLGIYRETEIFSGTDRLSTAMLHDIPSLCVHLQNPLFENYSLLAEGSRIFTKNCIGLFAAHFQNKVTLVELSSAHASKRREARGIQSAPFVQGIKTQVQGVLDAYRHTLTCYHFASDTTHDLRHNIETTLSLLFVS